MVLNWMKGDYFAQLLMRDKRSHTALEMLVDDLHGDKEKTINRFLCHSGSEDFLWGLVKLLGNDNPRVAGNSAYILGTLAESETGCYRVISLTGHSHPESRQILPDLTNMLIFEDAESVMNAAGTMGTLAESHEGRAWMLTEPCLDTTVQHITDLLTCDNLWTASNAALVLARLTISEEGCEKILHHNNSEHVLSRLVMSLGVDEAGRGMNAAFALGRLCDIDLGRTRLLGLPESERMISLLSKMLCCNDPGASKNACFAISCLATSKEGHSRLLKNTHSEDVLRTLSELLSSEDPETGWFAAMTLRTLASQPKGCLRLRDHHSVLPALKAIEVRTDLNSDLYEEVVQTIDILKRLEKPDPPRVEVEGPYDIQIYWDTVSTKSGFLVRYQLFEGTKCVFHGRELQYHYKNLQPHTSYTFKLRACTEGDDSPLSDPVTVTTEESTPGPPTNLRILGCTTTQLKIGWEPPDESNGILKGYYIYNGDKCIEHTYDLHSIISGLHSSSTYEICVCAATCRGKGPKEQVLGQTTELGAHAPAKPEVTVRGRNELNVSWKPPENPLSKITRYDVRVNGETTYSGMDLHHVVRRLKPDTEYYVTVSAITNEGKCESKPTKKRTAKDDFEGERAPLYTAPKKELSDVDKKEEPTQKSPAPRKRKESLTKSRSASAASMKRLCKSAAPNKHVRLALTHRQETDQNRTKDDTNKSDSSPEGSRPVSNTTQKEEAKKPESSESGKSKPLAQVFSWEYSLRSYTCPLIETLHRQQNPGSAVRQRTYRTETGEPTSSGSSEQKGSERSKSLPKPKPPVIKKTHKSYVPPSTSRSSDYTDITSSSRSNSGSVNAARAKINRERPSSEKVDGRETPIQDIDLVKPLNSSIHTKSRGNNGKEWGQKSSGYSRKSILKKRNSLDFANGDKENEIGQEDIHQDLNASVSSNKRMEQAQATSAVTKTFSTFNTGNFNPTDTMSRQKTGMIEFEAPLPQPSQTSGMTPSYVQRANTFINQHRNKSKSRTEPYREKKLAALKDVEWLNRPGIRRSSESVTRTSQPQVIPNQAMMIPNHNQWSSSSAGVVASNVLNSNNQPQWSPEFPQQRVEKPHGKFVPMQYRTQPANLPGGMKRQSSNMTNLEKAPIEVVARSKTDVGFSNNQSSMAMAGHMEPAEENYNGVRLGYHQRDRVTSSKAMGNVAYNETVRKPTNYAASPRAPVRNSSSNPSQSQHSVIKLGMNANAHSSLQSAR